MGETAFFGASAVTNFGQAYATNASLRAQSDYERRMTNVNTGWAQLRAEDSLRQGDFQAAQVRDYGEGVKASQLAAQSKEGTVDVQQGSAAQVRAETDALTQLDVLAARNNALKEMLGIQSDDAAARRGAKMNRIARRSQGAQSIINAGASTARDGALAHYYANKKDKDGAKGGSTTYGNRYGDDD